MPKVDRGVNNENYTQSKSQNTWEQYIGLLLLISSKIAQEKWNEGETRMLVAFIASANIVL